MSEYQFVHPSLQSSQQLSRRSAERYAQLEAVRRSRQPEREVRPRSLLSRLVHAVS